MDGRRLGLLLLGSACMAAAPAQAATYKVLHNFCAKSARTDGSTPLAPVAVDGDGPRSGLINDGAGDVVGTTTQGGLHGKGVVFELTL